MAALVKAQVVSDRLDMSVGNSALGGDPIENVPKQLTIDYSVGTMRGQKVFPEGTNAVLP